VRPGGVLDRDEVLAMTRDARWAVIGVAAAIAIVHGVGCAAAAGLGVHAIATPIATLALLAGALTLADRRAIDPRRWSTVLGLTWMSAAIWLALPHAAAVWCAPANALRLWGCAIAVWLAVPYCLRTPLRHPAWPVIVFVAGALAAFATRQLAVALVVGLAIGLARTPARRAWMWLGWAGALAGTAASIVHAPWRDAGRVVSRLDATLAIVSLAMRDSGQVVVLLGLLVLGVLVVHAVRPRDRAVLAALSASAGDIAAWLAASLGLDLALRLGPGDSSALLVPAVLALGIASWPVVRALAARPTGAG
jgi:hypothetical protein